MTLILTINGPNSIWMLADRRLSYAAGPPRDDARKVMLLEATDGDAILGYAGLGATARGTEPADWMSAVLRGRNMSLEQSLGVLARALKEQLPSHMAQMPSGNGGPSHSVLIPAFLGNESRLYTIDLIFTSDRKKSWFVYNRRVVDKTTRAPRLAIAGSGVPYLQRNKGWIRSLLRVIRAYDSGHASEVAVADYLAKLNYEVHLGMSEKTVGPRCIVAHRNSKRSIRKGGGGHLFYTGTTRDTNHPSLPSIVTGMDFDALVKVLMPHAAKMSEATLSGQSEPPNDDEINSEWARLSHSHKPDENLR
ncbi:MAG: hypothetical protein HY244_13220 [Rhizobiales bacterium]|nr:hypothetical protein [Hyphomicrobiales bacterium]